MAGKTFVTLGAAAILSACILQTRFPAPVVAGLVAFAPLMALNPSVYFIAFLLIRPSLDQWAEINVLGTEATGFGLNPASLASLGLILMCGLHLCVNPRSVEAIRRSAPLRSLNGVFFFWLLFASLSFVHTENALNSLNDLARLLAVALAVNYAVIHFGGSERGIRKFGAIVLLSAIVPLGVGLHQIIAQVDQFAVGTMRRIYGTFAHPNPFAAYLILIVWTAWFLAGHSRTHRALRLGLLAVSLLSLVELYHTFTRSAWIAFSLSLCVYALYRTRLSKKVTNLAALACVGVGTLPFVQGRFLDLMPQVGQRMMSSWEWRLHLWQDALGSLREHPFLGHGLGMFEQNWSDAAHNDLLRVAYEIGIPGVLAFLALFAVFMSHASKAESRETEFDRGRKKIALCLIVSLFVCALSDNMVRSIVVLLYYFPLAAVFVQGVAGRLSSMESAVIERTRGFQRPVVAEHTCLLPG